jgi:hypothetical protein
MNHMAPSAAIDASRRPDLGRAFAADAAHHDSEAAHRSATVAWRGKQWLSWLVPALLAIAWELFARLGKLPPYILPAPTKVVATGVALIEDGTLIPDMGISLRRNRLRLRRFHRLRIRYRCRVLPYRWLVAGPHNPDAARNPVPRRAPAGHCLAWHR